MVGSMTKLLILCRAPALPADANFVALPSIHDVDVFADGHRLTNVSGVRFDANAAGDGLARAVVTFLNVEARIESPFFETGVAPVRSDEEDRLP